MIQATCFGIAILFGLIVLGNNYPWVWLVIVGIIVLTAVLKMRQTRNNKVASVAAFEQQANALTELAANIQSGQAVASPSFALKTGEVALGSSDNVRLLEWVSTGSSYRGGSTGFSFRVMKGVSYRVGQSRGTLIKNPPALSTLDHGTVHYTTDRITFVGNQQTRSWDVSKMLDLNVDHNGQTVMISVSNRQKPSGLQGGSFEEPGPGFMVRAALTTHNSGAKEAATELLKSADDLRVAAQQMRVELKISA